MNDDYLWDRSGEPDRDVRRLEELLAPLRHSRPAPDFSRINAASLGPSVASRPLTPERPQRRRYLRPVLAIAAGVVLIALPAAFVLSNRTPTWRIASLAGNPRVGAKTIQETGELAQGEWLETDAASRAKIDIGQIGEVHVEPNTRLRMLQGRLTDQRLSLQKGTIHALIWAPPRIFSVETPSAVAVDLGCVYTLEVAQDGTGFLHVESGWVAFEVNGRESFVPAGALAITRPGLGPGTPYFEDAAPEFHRAVAELDTLPAGEPRRSTALDSVLSLSRRRDALTVWHLLGRLAGDEQARAYTRMAALVPPPDRVTRAGILSGDRAMLDAWWNALGLDDASWWRVWKGPVPSR